MIAAMEGNFISTFVLIAQIACRPSR